MEECLLVDGYNIVFAWPELNKMDIDHARDKLLSIMTEYRALSNMQVTVVFDAHLVRGGTGHTEKINGVNVHYTQEGETADSLIERLSEQLKESGRIFVATADACEQMVTFGYGAIRVTPAELKEAVSRLKSQAQAAMASGDKPAERYLENYLLEPVRTLLEKIRRQKS